MDGNPLRTAHYIDHETVGLDRRDMMHLESLVKSADWKVVIQYMSFLSAIESGSRMFGGEPIDGTVARVFIEGQYTDAILHQIDEGGVMVSKFGIALIANTALRLGEVKEGDGKLPSPKLLGELMLTANDIATQNSGTDPKSPQALSALIRYLSTNSGETPYWMISRYFQLLHEIPDTLPRDANWKDIRGLFHKTMNFEIDRLLGLGFGLFSHYGVLAKQLNERWRSKHELPAPQAGEWILNSYTFLKNTQIPQEEAIQLFDALSTDPDSYAKDSIQSNEPFDFTHLKTWPIARWGESAHCVPVVDFLFDRVTIRSYFDILEACETSEAKDAFGGFFGHVVEKYVEVLLEGTLGKSAGPLGLWFKPEDYEQDKGSPEGPDAIVLSTFNDSLFAVFVEVKSSRPSKDTLVSGDLDKLRDNWTMSLIGTPSKRKAARQLDRSIADFRSGALRIPNVDSSQVWKIYPVVITLDSWPFYFEIYTAFLEDVASKGLLLGDGIQPIDVWSAYDLELLSAALLAGGSLGDMMNQRNYGLEHVPMWMQIRRTFDASKLRFPLVDAAWERMTYVITEDLGFESSQAQGN